MEGKGQRNGVLETQPIAKRLVKKYRSHEEDLKWARRGMVGTVLNGESVPLIQNRVEDAGFQDVGIIPLGADKVFIHSLSGSDVSEIVGEARQFFELLFSHLVVSDKAVMPFQRGALLRVIGIPLHAWNERFSNYVFLTVDDFYVPIVVHWLGKDLITQEF